jgi:hypothetical protein
MQATGFGFTMPVYTIVHLLTSRTAAGPRSPALSEAIRISDLNMVRVLPAAIFFGYIIPTILMVMPMPWNELHQWLGGLWQGFPVSVVLIQYLLASKRRRRDAEASLPHHPPASAHDSTGAREMSALLRVYSLSFAVSAISHWATIAVLVSRWLLPSWFPPHLCDCLPFSKVFMPPLFWVPGTMVSMAEGIHNFFQYDLYVGAVASFVWVTALNVNTFGPPRSWRWWLSAFEQIVAQSVVAGPGGALVSLLVPAARSCRCCGAATSWCLGDNDYSTVDRHLNFPLYAVQG